MALFRSLPSEVRAVMAEGVAGLVCVHPVAYAEPAVMRSHVALEKVYDHDVAILALVPLQQGGSGCASECCAGNRLTRVRGRHAEAKAPPGAQPPPALVPARRERPGPQAPRVARRR